ncbi:MAG: nucleotide exchange factor GrpE [Jatrophihabitans sp.]
MNSAPYGADSEEAPPVVIRNNRKIDREPDPVASSDATGDGGVDAPESTTDLTLDAPQDETTVLLEERTRDLQRVSAEYANYRRRADRDRLAAGDVAVSRVLTSLLPVLDDLDRAAAHGDLTGPLKAVADKLEAVSTEVGLSSFGDVGDPFDPSRHEAVMHDENDGVTEPTCTTVMRRGYQHKDRLLRPAMVGVSDPITGAGSPDATSGAEPTPDDVGIESEPTAQNQGPASD